MHVCMYVCMHVGICIYVCQHVWLDGCILCLSMGVLMNVCVCVRTYVRMYACIFYVCHGIDTCMFAHTMSNVYMHTNLGDLWFDHYTQNVWGMRFHYSFRYLVFICLSFCFSLYTCTGPSALPWRFEEWAPISRPPALSGLFWIRTLQKGDSFPKDLVVRLFSTNDSIVAF